MSFEKILILEKKDDDILFSSKLTAHKYRVSGHLVLESTRLLTICYLVLQQRHLITTRAVDALMTRCILRSFQPYKAY